MKKLMYKILTIIIITVFLLTCATQVHAVGSTAVSNFLDKYFQLIDAKDPDQTVSLDDWAEEVKKSAFTDDVLKMFKDDDQYISKLSSITNKMDKSDADLENDPDKDFVKTVRESLNKGYAAYGMQLGIGDYSNVLGIMTHAMRDQLTRLASVFTDELTRRKAEQTHEQQYGNNNNNNNKERTYADVTRDITAKLNEFGGIENIEKATDQQLTDLRQLLSEAYSKNPKVYDSSYGSHVVPALDKEITARKEKGQTNLPDTMGNQVQQVEQQVQQDRQEAEQKAEEQLQEELVPQAGSKTPDSGTSYTPNELTSPDDVINAGQDFFDTGKNNQGQVAINGDKLQTGSSMLFNVLFIIGIAAAVLIGAYLGIKFMLASAEDKASIKESLLPYFAGVIIMFASFSIWRLVIILFQAIE